MKYTFVILSPEHEEFSMQICADAKSTFLQLHEEICRNLKFSLGEVSSFFRANASWEKELEITLYEMDEESESLVMDVTELHEVVSKVGDKLLYVYDFLLESALFIELNAVKEGSLEEGILTLQIASPESIDRPKLIEADDSKLEDFMEEDEDDYKDVLDNSISLDDIDEDHYY